LEDQAKTFRTEIYSLVKYEYLNTSSNLEHFDKLVSLQKKYTHDRNNLHKRKDKLYEEGVMSRWGNPEIMNRSEKPGKN